MLLRGGFTLDVAQCRLECLLLAHRGVLDGAACGAAGQSAAAGRGGVQLGGS